ncbi:S1 family peptidase [Amycolatopsis sp. H20-H5]|uniref:S1 family peptidase n=1 Tax=Amycolatopsis sp. H20-H5 TaxID=3046309 RepID=UPI002DB71E75|nr:trypsin-like serine protease [Amycolatopsis sp. H20-H5]MEC3976687.1 trypsin-like serine protease [Amycolatopsis sp. H20-H5]
MSRIRTIGAVTAAAIALTLSAGAIADASTPAGAQPSIIGGGTAPAVGWGAQVYVNTPGRDFGGFNCSGTIIAPQWVLTAIHCLDQDGSGMHVKVGSNTLGSGTDVEIDQEEESPNGDIALLHLASAVDTDYIKLGSADPKTGATNQLYGWGRTTPTGPPASALKVANVKVTGKSRDTAGGPAIQTVGVNGSAWKGDSGGPEIDNGVQVGVASTVQNQDGTNTRGTNNYGSVAASRSWIRTTSGV